MANNKTWKIGDLKTQSLVNQTGNLYLQAMCSIQGSIKSPGDQCLNQHNKDYLLIRDHIPIGPIPLDGLKVTNKIINNKNIAN